MSITKSSSLKQKTPLKRKQGLRRGTSQLKRSGFKSKSTSKLKSLKQPRKKSVAQKRKSVSQLKKLADKWFSQYIRLRDSENGVAECITCGVRKPISQMQNGHFVSRRVNVLRYDEENCNAQCMGCNVMKHGDLYEYAKKLDDKYGEGTAEKLHAQRFTTHKLTVDELEQIIHDAKESIIFLTKT